MTKTCQSRMEMIMKMREMSNKIPQVSLFFAHAVKCRSMLQAAHTRSWLKMVIALLMGLHGGSGGGGGGCGGSGGGGEGGDGGTEITPKTSFIALECATETKANSLSQTS